MKTIFLVTLLTAAAKIAIATAASASEHAAVEAPDLQNEAQPEAEARSEAAPDAEKPASSLQNLQKSLKEKIGKANKPLVALGGAGLLLIVLLLQVRNVGSRLKL